MSKKRKGLEIVGSVKSLRLAESSTIVVSLNYRPSTDQLLDYRDQLVVAFPNNPVIVLTPDVAVDVI